MMALHATRPTQAFPKMRTQPSSPCIIAAAIVILFSSQSLPAQRKASDTIVIAVSPQGSDAAAGTVAAPFASLQRAQQAARESNADHDIIVQLADGIYRLTSPLLFAARDGGRNGHHVTW